MEYYDIDFSELTVEEFAVLHITESMMVQGYDMKSIENFWMSDDEEMIDGVMNSLELIEEIFVPDNEFLTERVRVPGIGRWIDDLFKKLKIKGRTPKTSAGRTEVTPPKTTAGGRPITSNTSTTGSSRVTGTNQTGQATTALKDKVVQVLKKPVVKKTGIGGAVLGGAVLVGDQLTKNNIIPPIPQPEDGPEPEKGPVLDGPDGPKQFPPLPAPPPPVPKDDTQSQQQDSAPPKKKYTYRHWSISNNPIQYNRNPGLSSYRNIRNTIRNK
tara:strand:+ start:1182 stop:1991 length:810 start_codon:yes stop_codon:yes gene_type:complete